ncbi:hypothetical protein ACIHDR_35920 [Nocardia sp. NPDC052278]|uniref:hypothetical protein n=1 Tax=unclassified Nocardia TaxID=2637762 RepID=UPI003683B9C2
MEAECEFADAVLEYRDGQCERAAGGDHLDRREQPGTEVVPDEFGRLPGRSIRERGEAHIDVVADAGDRCRRGQ